MKKATLIIWVIIFGFIALVIFQNQDFFLAKNSLRFNPGISEEYLSPKLPNAILFLIFFFGGLIIAYLFSFATRFKAKRSIKKLNTGIASHITELSELRREINTLKGVATPTDGQSESVKLDMTASRETADDATGEGFADKSVKLGADEVTSNPDEANDTGESNIKTKY